MKRTFLANIKHLKELQTWIKDFLYEQAKITNTHNLELLAEEVFLNIIKYGYIKKEGHVDVVITYNNNTFTMIFTDWGIAFNPLEYKKEKQEGGCGLILIRSLIDNISYERKDNANILILTKKINH